MYIQAQNGMGEIDWSGIIKDITGGALAYKTASVQADAVKAQIRAQEAQAAQQAQQAQQALAYQFNPQYSPQYTGAPQSSNLMPIMLLGGAALLVFFMMKG